MKKPKFSNVLALTLLFSIQATAFAQSGDGVRGGQDDEINCNRYPTLCPFTCKDVFGPKNGAVVQIMINLGLTNGQIRDAIDTARNECSMGNDYPFMH